MSTLAGARQNVTAVAGFAYGAIGADIHVFGDGSPVYLLERHRTAAVPDRTWLRQLPSRMLNARTEVVPFTGREAEHHELTGWLASTPRLAVRWLHAPGGQGKTRLAAHLAHTATEQGWKVATAIHGVGAVQPSPGSQDLRTDGHPGVLLIVDYADRWTASALTWLLRNALLYHLLPTRVLLLARSTAGWPALTATLEDPLVQADSSIGRLGSLAGSDGARRQMFTAARDSFAALYDLADPGSVAAPPNLDHPEFGLPLTLHLAALVGVDARATGSRPPTDPRQLSGYLLNREQLHWQRLYEQRTQGLDHHTPPSVMARTAFTAALTGSMSYPDARTLLGKTEHELPAERIITDHGRCYPAAYPGHWSVLEPLYPDRLAEDDLALTLCGDATGQPPHPWATTRVDQILTLDHAPASPARAIIFLTAAATRWPRLGSAELFPRLRKHPNLALAAGGPTITALTTIPNIDIGVLEAIDPLLPPEKSVDLDIAAAAIADLLTPQRVAATTSPAEHARLHTTHAERLANAGRWKDALDPAKKAMTIRRRLADTDPTAHLSNLALSLVNLGVYLSALARHEEALWYTEEAVTIRRRLAKADPATNLPVLALALNNFSAQLAEIGWRKEALRAAREAVALYWRMAATEPTHLPELAMALNNLSNRFAEVGQWETALAPAEAAVAAYRRLAETNPARYLPNLAGSLNTLGIALSEVGQWDLALAPIEEAAALGRRLAEVNPAHLHELAMTLNNLSNRLSEADRRADAAGVAEEAVALYRQLAATNPGAYLPNVAISLNNLCVRLFEIGRSAQALACVEEAVAINRKLVKANDVARLPSLAMSLANLSSGLSTTGRPEQALAPIGEAVAIHRSLADANPAHRPHLAAFLLQYASVCRALGRNLPTALAAEQEAMHLNQLPNGSDA